MCGWKIVPIDNPGSAVTFGGDDLNKISKLLSGYDLKIDDSSDVANIQTETVFGSEKLNILSPTSGFKYIIRGQDIDADRVISLPLMSDDGEIQLSAAGTENDWGAYLQTFRHQNIKMMNPANTFGYLWNTSAIAANRNIILPLLAADDTVVCANAVQTLTNKTLTSPSISAMTINTDSNTIKHGTTNNTGDLLVNTGAKYDRFARGTADQVFCMNSAGTGALWVNRSTVSGGTDELVKVYEAGTQIGSVARKLNFDGATFNITEDSVNNRFNITGVAAASTGGTTTIYKNTSTVSVASTASETNLLNQTITAGSMGSNGILHVVLSGWYLNDGGSSANFTMRLKFGGTTIWEDTSLDFSDATIRKPMHMEFWVKNNNSASSQRSTGWYMFGESQDSPVGFSDFSNVTTKPMGVINGADSSISTASSQNLVITITHSTADSLTSVNANILLLELIT